MKNSNSTLADWRKLKEQKLFDYVGTETWITKQFVYLLKHLYLPHFNLTSPIQIFVERKTHREDWTGEKSVKARFPLKEHLINPFLRGEYTVDADFQQLVAKGKKSQQEVDSMIQLANEVQYAVLTKGLGPGEFFY
jgi:SPX domain protein involved in polyphosphate accumulation